MKDFEEAAQKSRDAGMAAEFWHLLRSTKKWWLLPLIGILFLFGLLLVLSGTAAAPFIYTLF